MRTRSFATAGLRALVSSTLVIGSVFAIAASTGIAGQASAETATPTNGSAQFFAGYILTPTHGVASASATFTVPAITCASGSGPGQSFGVWGFDSQTAYVGEAAVETYCSGTTPVYKFYILANSVNFTEDGVFPGDTVAASFYSTPNWTQATVHDLTSGYTWIANFASTFLPASQVEIGVDSIPGNGRVAPFSVSRFTKAQVNGDYLGYQSPSGYNWVRSPTLLVSASALTGGDAFKLVFHHS